MSFEQQQMNSNERKNGVDVCRILKEKEPDQLHWGNIDCSALTKNEELLIEKFDALKRDPSEEALFALDAETREVLEATGSNVAEVLINELVAFRYELKHKHN